MRKKLFKHFLKYNLYFRYNYLFYIYRYTFIYHFQTSFPRRKFLIILIFNTKFYYITIIFLFGRSANLYFTTSLSKDHTLLYWALKVCLPSATWQKRPFKMCDIICGEVPLLSWMNLMMTVDDTLNTQPSRFC